MLEARYSSNPENPNPEGLAKAAVGKKAEMFIRDEARKLKTWCSFSMSRRLDFMDYKSKKW